MIACQDIVIRVGMVMEFSALKFVNSTFVCWIERRFHKHSMTRATFVDFTTNSTSVKI